MKTPQMISTCLLLSVLLAADVHAHASLDHAEPKVGAQISASPSEIRLWFTQDIEPAFSSIEVRDSQGNQVDAKDCHPDAGDKRLLVVSVPKLAGGEYLVIWKVTSADTHRTHGDFKFTIKTGS